ncbi:MAG: PqqD family protein [Candidatus Omnitrophota bacterium]
MKFQKMMIERNAQAAWQEIEDNVVVVTPANSKVHVLSGIGGRVWQLLEEEKTGQQLSEIIIEEFDVGIEQVQADVDGFLQELLEKEIIKVQRTEDRKQRTEETTC